MRIDATVRAVEEWRDAHPDSGIPTEQIGKLLAVQQRAFGIACARCFEIECDDDCPNYSMRRAARLWREQ